MKPAHYVLVLSTSRAQPKGKNINKQALSCCTWNLVSFPLSNFDDDESFLKIQFYDFFRNFTFLSVTCIHFIRVVKPSKTTGSNQCHQATGPNSQTFLDRINPRHQSPKLKEYEPVSESDSQTAFLDLRKYVNRFGKTCLPIRPFSCALITG